MSDPEYAVKLTVVLPIFNEIGSLSELDRQLSEAITSLGFPCEVVCVDDGSTDGSWARLQELSSSNPMYRMVKLRRNYGQSAALAAGVDVARGEFIILMDADLQNDPADIPRLINEVHKGFDLVSGWRRSRQDFFWSRRLPSIIANSLIAKVTDVDLHDIGCTLKIYRSEYIKDITIYGDGSQTRSFCYVDDMTEAFVRLMNQDETTGPVNLGNPGEFTIKQLAEMVLRMTGSKSKLVMHPLPQDDPKQRKPDITLAKKVLQWEPKVPLEDGLKHVIDYFRYIIAK